MAAPAWLPANQAEFEFEAGPYKDGALQVIGFQGQETLSRPFHFEVELVGQPDQTVDTNELIGQPALLTVNLAGGGNRFVHGMVRRMAALGTGSGPKRRRYLCDVVPLLWKLRYVQRSRIFQNLSVPEILKKVLDEGTVKQRSTLDAGKYKKRIYCVQYRESDFAFVSRLMEEEGIYYWFEHKKNEHTLVLADSPSTPKPIPDGESKIVFREGAGMVAESEAIYAISQRRELRPGAVALRDFNFENPALDLTAQDDDDKGDPALEVYDYPGEYQDPGAGKSYAKVRLQEQRWRSLVCAGASVCRRLQPGFTIELEDHPDLDGRYLLVSVKHGGQQPQALTDEQITEPQDGTGYRNEFSCIPADVPFRPLRRTRRPIVQGPQTAIVTGPSGEEIHTDEHGRIKVQFHWDRDGKNDENTSCWIRCTQAWAGGGYGALYIPRIGQEVVVEFLEGDPDQPLVTGRVYNGLNPPPESLPGEKTKSTLKSNSSKGGGGSNELRFEDAAGSEEVFLHAQKDLNIDVENDKTQRVGGNEHLHVVKDRSREIDGNQDLTVKGNDQSTISGDQTLSVTGNRTVSVTGNHTETITGGQQISVKSSRTLMVLLAASESVGLAKALAVGGAYMVTVGGAMNEAIGGLKFEAVGGAKVEVVGGKKSETVGGSRTVKVKGDLREDAKGSRSVKAGQDMAVAVKGDYQHQVEKTYGLKAKEVALAAQDGLAITVGSAKMEFAKSGDIVIKGGKIEITADGDVVIKGSKITEN